MAGDKTEKKKMRGWEKVSTTLKTLVHSGHSYLFLVTV